MRCAWGGAGFGEGSCRPHIISLIFVPFQIEGNDYSAEENKITSNDYSFANVKGKNVRNDYNGDNGDFPTISPHGPTKQVHEQEKQDGDVDDDVGRVGKCQIFYTDQYQQTRFYPEKST